MMLTSSWLSNLSDILLNPNPNLDKYDGPEHKPQRTGLESDPGRFTLVQLSTSSPRSTSERFGEALESAQTAGPAKEDTKTQSAQSGPTNYVGRSTDISNCSRRSILSIATTPRYLSMLGE